MDLTHCLIICSLLMAAGYLITILSTTKQATNGTPVVVPSLLPWIGNLFEFQHDPAAFLMSCRQKYGRAFKILLFGQRIIVLSDRKGIALLNKDSTNSFTNKPVFSRVLKAMGVSSNREAVMDVLHRLLPNVDKALSPTSMVILADDIHNNLRIELLAACHPSKESLVIPLDILVSKSLYRAGCLALFGPTFPLDSFDDFELFHAKVADALMGITPLARDAAKARKRIINSFEAYITPLWAGEAVEGVSDIIATYLQDMREVATLQEAASLLLLFIFGFQSNTWYMVFWLLAHLLVNEDSRERLHNEHLESQRTGRKTLLVDSAITEIIRWGTTSVTARTALKDTSIHVNGEHIFVGKGEIVMADEQSLNHDPEVYPEPERIIIDRFMTRGGGVGVCKPAAFGGSPHKCPGRHLALFEIKSFVTTILELYTLKSRHEERREARIAVY